MLTLPRGAGAGQAYVLAIAADATRLADAVAYWRKRLGELGEGVLEQGRFTSGAMRFAALLPDESLDSLVSEFRGLFSRSDERGMTSRSGCLMSLRELSQHSQEPSADSVEENLRFLASSGGSSGNMAEAERRRLARGLILVREIYDLIRRHSICRMNASNTCVPFSELLAIYRQEGVLGIAPPQSSWAHAPVIATTEQGCRSHSFLLWDDTTMRHGFIVSHERLSDYTPSEPNEVSRKFGMAVRHLAIVCGLDSILVPCLVQSDELLMLYEATRRSSQGTCPALDELKQTVLRYLSTRPSSQGSVWRRQCSLASQADLFDGLGIGLVMARLESAGTPIELPQWSALLELMRDDLAALVDAHSTVLEPGGRVFLAPAEDSTDAIRCLALQSSWYGSRRRICTLLAHCHRSGYSGPELLAPYLAYLRYNVGEFNFVRCLCRFASMLGEFRTTRTRRRYRLAEPFVQQLERLAWSPSDKKAAADLLEKWSQLARTPLYSSPGWRHVGLADVLAAKGPVPCSPPPPPPWLPKAADTAKSVVELYADKGLFDLLSLFVLSHPILLLARDVNLLGFRAGSQASNTGNMDDQYMDDPRFVPLRNAFSFERLRRVYEKAVADSNTTGPSTEG